MVNAETMKNGIERGLVNKGVLPYDCVGSISNAW